jgi:hypothetical protein
VPLQGPLDGYATVRAWRKGLREQWGEEPAGWQQQLEALAAFCEFVGKEPDEIIAECTRESQAGKRISVKGRRFYSEKIAEWQASQPGDRAAQGRAGNAVRSFLIHNGIFIQSGIQA